jgi:hypothetical protein
MTHGGKRQGAGRKKGAVSQAKRDLSEMAKDHAETALTVLVEIARQGESEGARVSAANAILDRAYGKPPQALDHKSSDGSMSPMDARTWREVLRSEKS